MRALGLLLVFLAPARAWPGGPPAAHPTIPRTGLELDDGCKEAKFSLVSLGSVAASNVKSVEVRARPHLPCAPPHSLA
jgi:hypothetical protein